MKFIYDIHSKKTFGFYLSNVTLVFRSSCREEFWEKCVLRNTCPLMWTSETFVKSVKKIPVKSLATSLKMKFFSYFFDQFSEQLFFFRTLLSNCAFIIVLLIFALLEILIFFQFHFFFF